MKKELFFIKTPEGIIVESSVSLESRDDARRRFIDDNFSFVGVKFSDSAIYWMWKDFERVGYKQGSIEITLPEPPKTEQKDE